MKIRMNKIKRKKKMTKKKMTKKKTQKKCDKNVKKVLHIWKSVLY